MNKKFLSVVLFGALLASSAGTFTSCKDYDDDINGLQEQIDANKKTLDEKSAALQTALEKANADITAAKAAAAAAQTAADKAQATGDAAKLAAAQAEQAAAAAQTAAAQAKVDAIAEATRLVNELKAVVDKKVDQSVYDARVKVIDAHLNVIDGKLSDLATADIAIKLQIDALKEFQKAIEALNLTTVFPELQGQVTTLITDLDALEVRVANNETDIKTLKEDLQKVSTRIGNLEVRLGIIEVDVKKIGDKLNTLSSLLSHRLTSLTFVPSTFINGIEVINFATLEYKAWNNLLADETDGTTPTTINDGKTQAFYYANPTSVKKEDITTLSVLTQDATNITRATATPIITASLMSVGNDGKMVINLKKNSDAPFTDSKEDNVEKFTLIALKADIKTTEEELKNGLQPTVVSDWARLAETTVTPRIHYTEYEFGKAVTENLGTGVIPHFYPYTTIHDAVDDDAICSTDGKYIIKELEYTAAPFDLNTLAGVCSGTNNVMHNAADHGLAFEFKLVNYNLKSNGEEMTNQLSFAVISKDGKITSQARNGQPNNKDAIGREPLVQVVLRNTVNKEVVDVRYFKIKWTPRQEVKNLGNLGAYTDVFDKESCGKSYVNTVGTATMNDKVYAELNVSKEVFHQLNVLDTKVYATYETAKAGTPAVANLGSIKEINAEGSTTTINLEWTFPIDQNTITPAEYEAGQAVRTVYGRYTDKVEHAGIYPFELTLTLNITKMKFNAGYVQTYWNEGSTLINTNKDKVFQVNPALTSDETYGISKFLDCQFVADMLKGYNKAGAGTISRPLDLVADASAAVLVFDAARLKDILGIGWTCTDGVTLKKGNVTAATIGGSIIRLYENPMPTINAHGTPTTAAQELLGKNVPVKLVASYCNGAQVLTAELDYFLVNFIKPLEMTLSDVEDSFKDLLTNGSTISVSNVATVKETFGEKRNVWVNGYPAFSNLGQWYNVQNVTWNIAKAKTNLKKVGNDIIITANPEESNWSDFADKYKLTASPGEINANILTFVNNSGAHLQQAFQIAIPVYASVKWAPISQLYAVKKYVVLTVNPGTVK